MKQNKLHLLPYSKETFSTPLPTNKIIERLEMHTEEYKFFRLRPFMKTGSFRFFEGEVYFEGFKINELILLPNPFNPLLQGILEADGNKTKIKIKARPRLFALVLASLWIVIVSFIVLLMTIIMWKEEGFQPLILFFSVAYLFIFFILLWGFNSGKKSAMKALVKLLELEKV